MDLLNFFFNHHQIMYSFGKQREKIWGEGHFKMAPYSFLTARELVSKSRDGASFKKSTRKSRATSTTASNSHWSNFSNHRCSFPMC